MSTYTLWWYHLCGSDDCICHATAIITATLVSITTFCVLVISAMTTTSISWCDWRLTISSPWKYIIFENVADFTQTIQGQRIRMGVRLCKHTVFFFYSEVLHLSHVIISVYFPFAINFFNFLRSQALQKELKWLTETSHWLLLMDTLHKAMFVIGPVRIQ